MKNAMLTIALVIALVAGACAQDVTGSDEYQALEQEIATLEQQLSDTTGGLANSYAGSGIEVPSEVLAVLEEWWEANERRDGSVVELYAQSGYHLYGDTRYGVDELAAHLTTAVDPEWASEPYVIVADRSRGRYVVTRGVQVAGTASALTFELLTMADGELKIVQTDWTYAH